MDTFKSLRTVLICEFHTPNGDHDEKKKNISQDQSGGNTDEPQDINDKIQPAPGKIQAWQWQPEVPLWHQALQQISS